MKNLLFIALCFFLASCDENAETKEERSERLADIREKNERCKSAEYIYYSIGERKIKLQRDGFVVAYSGEDSVDDDCASSPENPLDVTQLVFFIIYTLSSQPDTTLGFKVNLSNNEGFSGNQIRFEKAQEKLALSGQEITDLPKVGGFFKYKKSEQRDLYTYFAVEDDMRDANNMPLTLTSCPKENWAAMCLTSFKWDADLSVSVSSQHKNELGLETWYEIYPGILKELEALEY